MLNGLRYKNTHEPYQQTQAISIKSVIHHLVAIGNATLHLTVFAPRPLIAQRHKSLKNSYKYMLSFAQTGIFRALVEDYFQQRINIYLSIYGSRASQNKLQCRGNERICHPVYQCSSLLRFFDNVWTVMELYGTEEYHFHSIIY